MLQSTSQILQTLSQMHILKIFKVHSTQELHQLKTVLEELRNQLEYSSTWHPPAGPTEAKQLLQE
jgi:hypothetical protein